MTEMVVWLLCFDTIGTGNRICSDWRATISGGKTSTLCAQLFHKKVSATNWKRKSGKHDRLTVGSTSCHLVEGAQFLPSKCWQLQTPRTRTFCCTTSVHLWKKRSVCGHPWTKWTNTWWYKVCMVISATLTGLSVATILHRQLPDQRIEDAASNT